MNPRELHLLKRIGKGLLFASGWIEAACLVNANRKLRRELEEREREGARRLSEN